jgi:hypothetical protein
MKHLNMHSKDRHAKASSDSVIITSVYGNLIP